MSSATALRFFKAHNGRHGHAEDKSESREPEQGTSLEQKEIDGKRIELLIEELAKKRISAAIEERDDMWRKHEKAQITYLQNESSQMLAGLHTEIERLQNEIRDANMRLYVNESKGRDESLAEENEMLRQRLLEAEQKNQELADKLEQSNRNALLIEQQLTKAINIFKNQLAYQGNKIRQLTEELRERSLTVAQLMAQLRVNSNTNVIHGDAGQRCRFNSHPAIPLDALFSPTGSLISRSTEKYRRDGLVRSVSVTYPGGRPNVIAQRCSYSAANPRPTHLPSLFSNWRKSTPQCQGGCSIEKPLRKLNNMTNERMPLTRSLHESDKSSPGDENISKENISKEK